MFKRKNKQSEKGCISFGRMCVWCIFVACIIYEFEYYGFNKECDGV